MSRIARTALRSGLAVGVLAAVSVVGATGASAAVKPSAQILSEKYACTATYPEVCLGIYYKSNGVIDHEQIQANLNANTNYEYILNTPADGTLYGQSHTMVKAGWAPLQTEPFTAGGTYCAVVHYGWTLLSPKGFNSDAACVTMD